MAKNNQIFNKLQKLALSINPLKNLSSSDIESLQQQSRNGNDIRLQMAYAEMEKITPIFSICIERRISEILNRGWKIVPLIDGDESLETTNQKTRLEYILKKSDLTKNGITDAIRHLGLYAFRGRSIVKPFLNEDDIEFIPVDNTHCVKDLKDNYYWIDDANLFLTPDDFSNYKKIPETEIIAISTDKPIDYAGLLIYLRQSIGELQWSRVIEKIGVPPVILTAPEGTTDGQFAQFTQRALAIFEGGSGVLPNGTDVRVMDSSRGQDPFTAFLEHQNDLIAILSLGSTASLFNQSSGLGSDLNSTQQKILNNIVANDCRRIQNAISTFFANRFGFTKVRFEFNALHKYDVDKILAIAKSLKDLGVAIDTEKLAAEIDLDIFQTEEKIKSEVWVPGDDEKTI